MWLWGCIHTDDELSWADAAARQADERDKGKTFNNCAPFINCKTEINNTEIDNAKDINIVMAMYNLIEYSDNYSKTSGNLWQYYKDEPNDNLANSESFKSKIKMTGNDGNTKKCWNNCTIKTIKQFLEISWNTIN